MTKPAPRPYILPDEKTPRVYGTLTILFAGPLLAGCLLMLGAYAVTPISRQLSVRVERFVSRLADEAMRRQRNRLAVDEITAETPQDRAKVTAALARMDAQPFKPANPMALGFAAMDSPVAMWYGLLGEVAGAILNALLILGGAGLVGLSDRGRRITVWACALKLVRLVIFVVVMLGWILPIQIRTMKAVMGPAMAQAQARAGGPGPGGPAMVAMSPEGFAAMTTSWVVAFAVLAAVYPTLVLIQLSRPRVKAACVEPRAKAAWGGEV